MPSRTSSVSPRDWHPALWQALVLFLSLCTFRVAWQIIGDWEMLARWAFDILEGEAQFRAWQNRLLAPAMIRGLSLAGLSETAAFLTFFLAGLCLHNAILFALLRRSGMAAGRAVWWVGLYCFGFLFLTRQFYLASDPVDMIVFTLLGYMMLARAGRVWLTVLFAVAILNRETGLFVALYLMLDGIRPGLGDAAWAVDRGRLIWGVALMALGAVYTKLARDILFVATPDGGLDARHALVGNHFYLPENLHHVFWSNWNDPDALHTVLVLVFLGWLAWRFREFDLRRKKAAAVIFAYVAGVMVFGLFNELRMLLPLLSLAVPFLATWREAERAGG